MNVSKVVDTELMTTMTGTPFYVAPEVWKSQPYDFKSDIWSLGVILYELAALTQPFYATNIPSLYNLIQKGKYERIPKEYSDDLAKLIDMWLTVKLIKRPSSKELLKKKVLRENVEDEDLDSGPHYASGKLMATIKPSANINIIKNRLPTPKYRSWERIPIIEETKQNKMYMTPNLSAGKLSSPWAKKSPKSKFKSPASKKTSSKSPVRLPKIKKNAVVKKNIKSTRAKYLSPGGVRHNVTAGQKSHIKTKPGSKEKK